MNIGQVAVGFDKEVVCMAMDDRLVAVGSQSHVTLVDPRRPQPVFSVESPDVSHGRALPVPFLMAWPCPISFGREMSHPVRPLWIIQYSYNIQPLRFFSR